MLVIQRKRNESILIGDNIRIMVVDVDRGKVKVGIQAPRDIPVHREEIQRRIQSPRSHEQWRRLTPASDAQMPVSCGTISDPSCDYLDAFDVRGFIVGHAEYIYASGQWWVTAKGAAAGFYQKTEDGAREALRQHYHAVTFVERGRERCSPPKS